MWLYLFAGAIVFVLVNLYPLITESLKMDSDYWKDRMNFK